MPVALERPVGPATIAIATGIPAPSVPAPASRVRILTEIASRYDELVTPLNGPDGIRGDGQATPAMPKTYTATLREFERLVVELRATDRELWRHLDGWWLSASTRTIYQCPRCGPTHAREHVHPNRRSGRPTTIKTKRVVVWVRIAGARESIAKAAIVVVASRWALEIEPMLPDEIRIG